MADPLLSVFPPALLRLILCGGEGLPAAWGPLLSSSGVYMPWDPAHRSAIDELDMIVRRPLKEPPAYWRLPLDHWRARLAVVAAYLITHGRFVPPLRCAWVTEIDDDDEITLHWVEGHGEEWIGWHAPTGDSDRIDDDGNDCHAAPSLPAHLLDNDPVVALLLAMYDVPEIRARVEALYA